MGDENQWRTASFRQGVVTKIDEAVARSGMPTLKNSIEMENHVFQKAKSKEEYLAFVARLILHVREMKTKSSGGMAGPGGPGQMMQDPINALQTLARQGTGNNQMMGMSPGGMAPGDMGGMVRQQAPQNTASNLLQTLNQRPPPGQMIGLQGMPNKLGMGQGQMGMNPNQQGQMVMNPGQQGQMGMNPNQQGPMGMNPNQQGPMGMNPNQQGQMGMNPSQQGQMGMNPNQQGPMGMNPNQQAQMGMNPNQQGQMGMNPGQQGQMGMNPGQQGPMGINPGQQGPMGMNPGQQGPMGMSPGQQGPMGMNPGQQGPMGMNPGQQGPMGMNPGQQGPMGMNPGQQGPMGMNPGQGPMGQMTGQQLQGMNMAQLGMGMGGPIHMQQRKPGDMMMGGQAGFLGPRGQAPPNQFLRQSPSPSAQSPAGMGQMAASPALVPSPSGPQLAPSMGPIGGPRSNGLSGIVQSPGSALNTPQQSAGTTSPGNILEEQQYREKVRQLSKYIEPLRRMIARMGNDDVEKLSKMKKLLEILSNPSKRMPLETLRKCEVVLEKMDLKRGEGGSVGPYSGHTMKEMGHLNPLLEAVSNCLQSSVNNHTLQRTFGPTLETIFGPEMKMGPWSCESAYGEEPKSDVPEVLQGEIARLDQRFKVSLDGTHLPGSAAVRLICCLDDKYLPAVPPVSVSVPADYPCHPPRCSIPQQEYASTEFLSAVHRALCLRVRKLPTKFSLSQLLDAWEMSVRLACEPPKAAA